MSSFVVASALLLGLLVPVVIRIFMKKRTHVDTAVVLVPVSIFVLILYVCAFGVQLYTVLLALVVLLVFLTNFRALQRYINGLYVDFFRVPFVIFTVLCAFAILFMSFLLYWFAPRNDMSVTLTVRDKPSYSVTKTMYTGTAYQGLTVKENFLDRASVVANTYIPDADDASKPLVVLVPDVCVRAADYDPLMKVLAERGYACTAADIKTTDTAAATINGTWIRPFAMRVKRVLEGDAFSVLKAEYNQKKMLETVAYINALKQQFPGRKILVVADEAFALIYRENLEGVKTIHLAMDGIAFLPLTHPLDAAFIMPEKYPLTERRVSDRILYDAADFIIGECK